VIQIGRDDSYCVLEPPNQIQSGLTVAPFLDYVGKGFYTFDLLLDPSSLYDGRPDSFTTVHSKRYVILRFLYTVTASQTL
jgi:hypothetical protein